MTTTESRVLRGSLTAAYGEGYTLGEQGLPLTLPAWAHHQYRFLVTNGHADGMADRAARARVTA